MSKWPKKSATFSPEHMGRGEAKHIWLFWKLFSFGRGRLPWGWESSCCYHWLIWVGWPVRWCQSVMFKRFCREHLRSKSPADNYLHLSPPLVLTDVVIRCSHQWQLHNSFPQYLVFTKLVNFAHLKRVCDCDWKQRFSSRIIQALPSSQSGYSATNSD